MANLPTVAQTAAAINGVRHSSKSEEEFNRFLVAIERHYGTEHLKAAHALAIDLYQEEEAPTPYKAIGRDVGEWRSGMYRFYCTMAAWPYSPAARAGYSL